MRCRGVGFGYFSMVKTTPTPDCSRLHNFSCGGADCGYFLVNQPAYGRVVNWFESSKTVAEAAVL
jgi:hypothetical protein